MSADLMHPDAVAAAAFPNSFEQVFCVDADHPCLPGHFPGQPLVPGVILLEQVAIALRAWRGQRLGRITEAKFVAPLLPGEDARVRLTPAAVTANASIETGSIKNGSIESAASARIRFEIFRDDTLLARGMVEGAA